MKDFRKNIFPPLREEDIYILVTEITRENGGKMALYLKGDTVSMYFDEVFGPMNWTKEIKTLTRGGNRDMTSCTISVYDEASGRIISKDGIGGATEWDPDKGEETDALKRAASFWGLGRELKHNVPTIYFPIDKMNVQEVSTTNGTKLVTMDQFEVSQIRYLDEDTVDRRIVSLCITDITTGNRFIIDKKDAVVTKREKLDQKKTMTSNTSSEKATPVEQKSPEETVEKEKSAQKSVKAGSFVVDLEGQLKDKKLFELAPVQVVWLYENNKTSEKLKEACKSYAAENDIVKDEFMRKGYNF